MANRATVTYNGKTISTEDRDGSFAVTYNGSTIATIRAGSSKTINCSGQPMKTDIVVGGKTLRCKNLKMYSNVVVSVKSLVDSVLANNSWATISAISRAGQAQQYWKVGDTKTFTCNGTTYTAQIIGFDHDDVSDSASYGRSKAGITFQFKEAYAITYKMDTSSYVTSYTNSDMHSSYLPAVLSGIESALSSVLIGVNKTVSKTISKNETITNQKLILPAAMEIKGKSGLNSTDQAQGTQYAFYSAGNSAVKTTVGTTTKIQYWTRTLEDDGEDFLYCYTISTSGSLGTVAVNTSKYIAPIFFV